MRGEILDIWRYNLLLPVLREKNCRKTFPKQMNAVYILIQLVIMLFQPMCLKPRYTAMFRTWKISVVYRGWCYIEVMKRSEKKH